MAEARSSTRKRAAKPTGGAKAASKGSRTAAAKAPRQATTQPPRRRVADTNGDAEANVDVALLENLLDALAQATDGDFKVRLSTRRKGVVGDLHAAFNDLAERNRMMTRELERIGRVIGREGRMTERASLGPVAALQTRVYPAWP